MSEHLSARAAVVRPRLPVVRLAWAQVAWLVALAVLWTGGMFRLPLDADYTSGELLDHLMSWRSTGVLYSDPSVAPYRVLNYPPLFLALARGLWALGIPPLFAARLLGTLGVAAALAVVYRWLRQVDVQREIALGVVALAAASLPIVHLTGQFHLEGLAVATTAAGFYCAQRRTPRTDLIAGTLLGVACLTKQSQVALTLVALAWVLTDRGVRGWRVLTTYAVTGAVGCTLITGIFGMEAWRHMLTYTVGTFSLAQLGMQLASHALPWIVFAAVAFSEAFHRPANRRDARTWYLAGTTVWLLSSARVGASYTYFLDWQLAVMLWVGPAVQRWLAERGVPERRRWRWAVGAAFAVQVLFADVIVGGILGYDLRVAQAGAATLATMCAAVPPAPELTVSESPGLVRACGGLPALHPFIISNLTARGLWNETTFVQDLTNARYATVVLPFDPAFEARGVHAERWTPAMIAAIRQGYQGSTIGSWWVGERSRVRPAALR